MSAPTQASVSVEREREDSLVPRGLRIAAAWSWRWIAIIVALLPIGWFIAQAKVLVIPLLVAALFSALLSPLMTFLQTRLRAPRWLATIATLIVFLAAIAVLLWLVGSQLSRGVRFDDGQLQARYQDFLAFLRDSPLHVTEDQISGYITEGAAWVQANVSSLLGQAVTAGSTVVEVAAGSLVTLFALIFFLLDGDHIWRFIVSLFPRAARPAVSGAGSRSWVSVGQYVRVQVVVAAIDAIGIMIGALILQVPFAIPIGVIVFLASFVPFVGAIASGGLAVLVALVYNGFWPAVIMLIVVVGVMQLESHVLQPFIMGNAVKVHPLAVVLAVSAGSLFGGIAGAVFAVPIVAAGKVAVQYIASGDWRGDPGPGSDPARAVERGDATPATALDGDEPR